MHERFGERVRLETDALLAPERWEGTSTQELIEEVVKHLVALFEAHDGVLRAALSEAVRDHTFTERAAAIALRVRERLSDLLEPRRPEMKITGFEESFDIGFRVVRDYEGDGPRKNSPLTPVSKQREPRNDGNRQRRGNNNRGAQR